MKSKQFTALAALLTSLIAPAVQADSGSDWLDLQVQKLQQQVALRNQIAVDGERFASQHGFTSPQHVVARANDDAFGRELTMLSHWIQGGWEMPTLQTEAGSAWLDQEMRRLQRHVATRNTLADQVAYYQGERGYVVPEQVASWADGDAFSRELALLSQSIRLQQLSGY